MKAKINIKAFKSDFNCSGAIFDKENVQKTKIVYDFTFIFIQINNNV